MVFQRGSLFDWKWEMGLTSNFEVKNKGLCALKDALRFWPILKLSLGLDEKWLQNVAEIIKYSISLNRQLEEKKVFSKKKFLVM